MLVKPIRSLFDALNLMHRGRFAERCDDHLQKAIAEIEASQDDKAKASITLTITIQRLGDRIDVKPDVKSKLPEEKGFQSVPFWTVEGGLSVQHPNQTDMFGGPRDTRTDDRFSERA